jgi:DNA-binding SARP family transcriptional activator/tRNA A-37 threonylcarbamoyl transferase component Bud32
VSAEPRIGTELAGYRIEALLGRGGMAAVYLATHLHLKRKVALKLLAPDFSEDDLFRARFLRESELAASIDHPNVIPIYDAGEAGGLLYLAMRHVEGTDLARVLEQEGRIPAGRALALLRGVAEALDAAHARGLVHRDVKPANVLIALDPAADPPEHVYLADFGLTKPSEDRGLTQTGHFVGTADYVAPEQIAGRPPEAAADVYALGCVLFECLTGEPPFRRGSLMATLYSHVNDPPPSASERNAELPEEIDAVIARALAKGPRERYASCRELIAAARAVLEPVAPAGPPDVQKGAPRAATFRILGPLEVSHDGEPVELGGPKPRALLAVLLVNAGEVVTADRLIDELWGEAPPKSAGHLLHVYVSSLRKALAPLSARAGRQIIGSQPPGYVLELAPDELDARRFERLVAEGRRELAGGNAERAAELLGEALGLWRGPALADFTYEPFAQAEIARLEELRLVAREERIEAELALGRHTVVVPELERLAAENPFRERLHGQLMLALYRCGRQADALEAFRQARRALVEELGIEPGPSLRRLQQAILRHDASLELLAAGSPPPVPARTTRKLVTVVAADLAPSAELDGLDAEARDAIASRVLDLLATVLARRGAQIERVAGEAILGVFGVPVASEDDALRAVAAAAEARDEIAADRKGLTAAWGVAVAPRVGVEAGEVLVADAGGRSSVRGDPVARALRLTHAGAGGEVLLGETAYRLVRHAVLAEDDGETDEGASGIAGRRRLLAVVPEAPALPRRPDAPLVGRVGELAGLRAAFDRVATSRDLELITVIGEAGVGKSRLARELAASLGEAAAVVVGRCVDRAEGEAFRPMRELVRQTAGEETREAVARLLGDAADRDTIAERVLAAVGSAEAEGGREEAFWAFRRLLEAAAGDRPLVVLFEDVHWAEPTFLELVEYLAGSGARAPMLVVCLARPELLEARPAWLEHRERASTIALRPLSAAESHELVERLVGDAPLPDEARVRLVQGAEGNPLFLEQMLAMLSEEGRVGHAITFPPTIQAVLLARLDRLGPAERAVLDRSAIVGRDFWPDAVAALLPEDARPSLSRHLKTLEEREYVRPDYLAPQAGKAFRFRHALIQEAAYRAIPKQLRGELHERLADWLEHEPGTLAAEHDAVVGYHLEQAFRYREELRDVDWQARQLATRASVHLAAAGRRALAREDAPAAVNLLERAGSLAGEEDPTRLQLLPDLVEGLRELPDLARAGTVASEAVACAAAAGDRRTEALARLERAYVSLMADRGDAVQDAFAEGERAAAVFRELEDELGLAKAWRLVALAHRLRGEQSARREALEQALAHVRRIGDRRMEARIIDGLGGIHNYGPPPVPEILRFGEESLAWARRNGQRFGEANCLAHGRGRPYAMLGDFAAARQAVAQAREIAHDLGHVWVRAGVASAAGFVETLAGNAAAAAEALRDGYELVERSGMTGSYFGMALRDELGQALYALGRYEEAGQLNAESERSAAPDDVQSQVQWRSLRAKLLAREGRFRDAERLAREAVALVERTELVLVHAGALLDLAEVLRLSGRPSEAIPILDVARGLYERKGDVVSTARAQAELDALRAGSPATVG